MADLWEKEITQEDDFTHSRAVSHTDTTPQTHTYSKQIVESGQSFQEEVSTFVRELVPSSDEEEQTFIQVKVKVPEGQTQWRVCHTDTSSQTIQYIKPGFFWSILPFTTDP